MSCLVQLEPSDPLALNGSVPTNGPSGFFDKEEKLNGAISKSPTRLVQSVMMVYFASNKRRINSTGGDASCLLETVKI